MSDMTLSEKEISQAQTTLLSKTRKVDQCVYCLGKNTIRRGKRKKKNEIVQLYFCHDCSRTFTGQTTKGRQYPLRLILDGLSYYNTGFTYEESCNFLKIEYGINVPHSTLASWAKQFSSICPYNKMRAYGLNIYSPREKVISSRFQHRQIYHYRYHRAKTCLLLEEYKHRRYSVVQELLDSVITDCPHNLFNSSSRASRIKSIFSHDQVRVTQKKNTAVYLSEFVLQAVNDNAKRHDTLQKFMIANDSVTVATEVPIVLYNEDLEHMRESLKFKIPKDLMGPITGHIDILQIRNGAVHIIDYKPKAHKVNAVDQLTVYALALSRLTGLRLYEFRCAWFDNENYYEFFPLHVVYKKKKRKTSKAA